MKLRHSWWRDSLKLPTEHIQEDRSVQRNDLIWMTRNGDHLFPIEFQSSYDDDMDMRLTSYFANAVIACRRYTGKRKTPVMRVFLISNIGNAEKFIPPEFSFVEDCRYTINQFTILDMIDFRPKIGIKDSLVSAIHNLELFRIGKSNREAFVKTMHSIDRRVDSENHSLNMAFPGWLKSDLFRGHKEAREILENSNTIKGALKMLENAMPGWESSIFNNGRKEGREEGREEGRMEERTEVIFGVIRKTFNIKDIPEKIRKMALRTCEKIGGVDSLFLIQSSSTLNEYAKKISVEQDDILASQLPTAKKTMPRP